ncbi:hypothetical protein N9061_01275 [bacterium]|nr:hypothetical protein [bacterium]MDA7905766.1 hypothetical protein [Mariniblastus sp.]MDB4380255.1 hypothetical protein [Mariniblastus sp.]MDB4483752.1 hypothetical protein [bacterium]
MPVTRGRSTKKCFGVAQFRTLRKQLARILKRFPEGDTDKDAKLSTDEIQQFCKSRQSNRRSVAAEQPMQANDAKLNETLAGINARGTGQRFKEIVLDLFEWPSEVHEKLEK